MNSDQVSAFHLVLESTAIAPSFAPGRGPQSVAPATLIVPAGVSFLRLEPGTDPCFTAAPPEPSEEAVTIESARLRDGQPRLLLLTPASAHTRLNEDRAPRVALLRERDQLQFDGSFTFHVAIFHRPQIGPAPADKIGKPCPICLTPFTGEADCTCYRCACGAVLHLQEPPGLDCARAVHDCPICHQPISLNPGYSWLPNLES